MTQTTPTFVAVDVSKAMLDIATSCAPFAWQIPNDPQGVITLKRELKRFDHPHIVCEATGRYTRQLRSGLDASGIPISIINPRFIRDFTRGTGKLAKTDALDAKAILRFAQAMTPDPTPPVRQEQLKIAEQVRRRRQLVDMLAVEKQRMAGLDDTDSIASITAHLAFLKAEIKASDKRIANAIAADPEATRKARLLVTIPGIAATTAAVLIAELPELGSADQKQIAALAGVAPMNRDSGKWRGQAHIAGGRVSARCALYMATVVAIRVNPAIKPFYQRLRQNGKLPKVAITAAMRKLVIIANALIQKDRTWTNPT